LMTVGAFGVDADDFFAAGFLVFFVAVAIGLPESWFWMPCPGGKLLHSREHLRCAAFGQEGMQRSTLLWSMSRFAAAG
jgi:hypothetical protein